ncbi:hypothetical protein NL676_013294 [Syzygium grande]|nr:hypothetical protein NL676_013294 [Syzygium grande]
MAKARSGVNPDKAAEKRNHEAEKQNEQGTEGTGLSRDIKAEQKQSLPKSHTSRTVPDTRDNESDGRGGKGPSREERDGQGREKGLTGTKELEGKKEAF